MRVAPIVVLCALVAAASSCGGAGTDPGYGNGNPSTGNPGGGGGSTTASITVGNNYYGPSTTTISPGTVVTWTWSSCAGDGYGGTICTEHTVLFDDGPNSATRSEGTWSRTFPNAGTYPYHCAVHGTSMSGSIVVR